MHTDYDYGTSLKNNQRYVSFSVDLGEIGLASQYRILFYTRELKDGQLIWDFGKWISVPPPQVSLSLEPNTTVELRNGEQKNVDVFVNSTTGFDQLITLSTNDTSYIDSTFLTNKTFHLPPYDLDARRIKVNATINNAKIIDKDYPLTETLRITANSTPTPVNGSNIAQQNTITNTYLHIKINRALSTLEQVWEFVTDFNKAISPISGIWTFLIGILTVSVPWAIRRSRRRRTRR